MFICDMKKSKASNWNSSAFIGHYFSYSFLHFCPWMWWRWALSINREVILNLNNDTNTVKPPHLTPLHIFIVISQIILIWKQPKVQLLGEYSILRWTPLPQCFSNSYRAQVTFYTLWFFLVKGKYPKEKHWWINLWISA